MIRERKQQILDAVHGPMPEVDLETYFVFVDGRLEDDNLLVWKTLPTAKTDLLIAQVVGGLLQVLMERSQLGPDMAAGALHSAVDFVHASVKRLAEHEAMHAVAAAGKRADDVVADLLRRQRP